MCIITKLKSNKKFVFIHGGGWEDGGNMDSGGGVWRMVEVDRESGPTLRFVRRPTI